MKRLLVALALLIVPSIASAAPQTITIRYQAALGWWLFESAEPPISLPSGAPAPVGLVDSTSARVTAALVSLGTTDGRIFLCKAKAFLRGVDFGGNPLIAISSLNAKNCAAQN